jgi:hypothetical protein
MRKKNYIPIIIIFFIFIFIILLINKNKKEQFRNNRLCLFYAYYEKDEKYKNNFEFFLNNGGILNEIDYYIIINGDCTVDIPKRDNISVFKRENKGYDFGAFSYAIKNITKDYDYYFFMNASVCGPYLDNKHPDKKWYKYFLKLFYDKDVKVVGTSIHILIDDNLKKIYGDKVSFSHVMSMFFCLDREYFTYLKNINFFNEDECNNARDLAYIIVYKEIGLSQIAINNGWNINSILSKYKNHDYRTLGNLEGNQGDPYMPGTYFGETIDKYDVIFFKNTRFN